jgi:hypothetical protein
MGMYVNVPRMTVLALTCLLSVLINLPVAAAALLLLVYSLKDVPLRPATGMTWQKLYHRFDILGL